MPHSQGAGGLGGECTGQIGSGREDHRDNIVVGDDAVAVEQRVKQFPRGRENCFRSVAFRCRGSTDAAHRHGELIPKAIVYWGTLEFEGSRIVFAITRVFRSSIAQFNGWPTVFESLGRTCRVSVDFLQPARCGDRLLPPLRVPRRSRFPPMAQPLSDLIDGLSAEVAGRTNRLVSGAKPLETAESSDMAFVLGRENLALAEASAAGVLFSEPDTGKRLASIDRDCTLVLTEDPKGAFFAALARLRPARRPPATGVSINAHVHPSAKIGPRTNVRDGASIEEDAVIGSDCEIGAGAYVGFGTRLGDNVHLHPNVVLYHEISIGNRVAIQAGSVIGADGFGYRTENGRHERLHHFGTVRIEDDVDIGACTTIDRALIGETVIGRGTKIDNNVVIAHNCRLGEHNLLVSQVGFAGSVTTGDYVVCAGQVGVADHVHLGTGAILGAKAGVHKDLAGGRSYLGAPAAPIAEATRSAIALQKLPQLRKNVREMERQLAELKARIGNDEASSAA